MGGKRVYQGIFEKRQSFGKTKSWNMIVFRKLAPRLEGNIAEVDPISQLSEEEEENRNVYPPPSFPAGRRRLKRRPANTKISGAKRIDRFLA